LRRTRSSTWPNCFRSRVSLVVEPLQVALEPETVYRSLDPEHDRACRRSIHDPRTGLFTPVYPQDGVSRQSMRAMRAPFAAPAYELRITVSIGLTDIGLKKTSQN
jgi:hypothetical protein